MTTTTATSIGTTTTTTTLTETTTTAKRKNVLFPSLAFHEKTFTFKSNTLFQFPRPNPMNNKLQT